MRLLTAVGVAAAMLGLGFVVPCAAQGLYLGRPIYSEPSAGLQLPPTCSLDPSSRARLGNSELELWVVECDKLARLWLLKRAVVEMVGANQARLRFQILEDQPMPEEVAGESLSVQCTGRSGQAAGLFAVAGAKWRPAGNELRLTSAQSAWRVDPKAQKLVSAGVSNVDCVRYPEREAMMRRLQQGPR
jgi:hypothetical protein